MALKNILYNRETGFTVMAKPSDWVFTEKDLEYFGSLVITVRDNAVKNIFAGLYMVDDLINPSKIVRVK